MFTLGIAVLFMGGLIAGWEPGARLAKPFATEVNGTWLYPEGLTDSTWMLQFLGPNNNTAVDVSNMHFMLLNGNQLPLTGYAYGIQQMLNAKSVNPSVLGILKTIGVRYVVVDRRQISSDQMVGVFLNPATNQVGEQVLDRQVYEKFDQQKNVSRILDSGNIVIYDVGALSGAAAAP